MAGVIGLRGPDIAKRDALRGYKVEFLDADRPYVRPHTGLPVLVLEEGVPKVQRHVFGFSRRFSSFNAREDRLADGKMWKPLFAHAGHHGVAPVSYILEWSDVTGTKTPYRIERADGAAMAVPALVGAYWEARDERAFALVTITPNRFVASFHDRMIGQLRDEDIAVWLHPEAHTEGELRACLAAPPDDELVAYPLRGDVGGARFDDTKALEAVGPALRWADVASASAAAPDGLAKPRPGKARQATL